MRGGGETPGRRPAGTASVVPAGEPAVTVLHISDTQFGAHHVFGKAGLTEADRTHASLLSRLCDDLRGLTDHEGLQPDLVVVTGDLAETGRRGEFDQVLACLTGLSEQLEVPRERVTVVPGNHDVNRSLCAGYFKTCEGNDEEPVPPYWPKWQSFAKMFNTFYDGVDGVTFAVDQPWSLFAMAELKVVVVGLNSTMAETHEEHYGWLGEDQLRRVAGALRRYERDGWLRIGALHHNPIRGAVSDDENLRDADELDRILGRHLNLLLHGHTHDGRSGSLPSSGLPVVSAGSVAVHAPARPSEVP